MIKWLKSLFGVKEAAPAPKEEAPKPKKATPAKIKATKKETKVKKAQDEALTAMTKSELLDVAKVHGIKANASLKKSELIERIKNG